MEFCNRQLRQVSRFFNDPSAERRLAHYRIQSGMELSLMLNTR